LRSTRDDILDAPDFNDDKLEAEVAGGKRDLLHLQRLGAGFVPAMIVPEQPEKGSGLGRGRLGRLRELAGCSRSLNQ
jgi:hypothetical protein